MVFTETLSSLAMLKIHIDHGSDYLDYLTPYILHILSEKNPDPVTDVGVQELIRSEFGLEIPTRTIQVVLRRISKKYPLEKSDGKFHIVGSLPASELTVRKSEAKRNISAVTSGLIEFDSNGRNILTSESDSIEAISGFLSEFNIPCLRAYLRGTAIPSIKEKPEHIVLVSEYVMHLQNNDPERFESFMILVQGHMLANALLCPDLQNAPKSYKGVTFYLDTPLLIQQLGLEGEPKKQAVTELASLLKQLGGNISTFSHNRDELDRVLKGVADHVGTSNGRGAIILEARKNGTTKSDLILLTGKIDDLLHEAGISIENTPNYIEQFQIDETAFGKVLDDEVAYFYNPRAREYDINSVRSIYALRANTSPSSLEKCKAVLVSSNSAFARAAYEYGKNFEESREVSSVITDFSLANMAWLKAPMGAPSIPRSELIAFSYAALRPTKSFLDKLLNEIERLQQSGKISSSDHQLLRSSTIAQDELVRLTLGDETALNEETISEALRRVSDEIRAGENSKFQAEQASHRSTQEVLKETLEARNKLQQHIYWSSQRKALLQTRFISGVLVVFLIMGIASGIGLKTSNPVLAWCLIIGTGILAVATILNLLFGSTIQQLHTNMQRIFLKRLLVKEGKISGISFLD